MQRALRGHKKVTKPSLEEFEFLRQRAKLRYEEVVETYCKLEGTNTNIWKYLGRKRVCLNTDWKSKKKGRRWVLWSLKRILFFFILVLNRIFKLDELKFESCESFPNHLSRLPIPLCSPLALYFSVNVCHHVMYFIFYLYICSLFVPVPIVNLMWARIFLFDCFIHQYNIWNSV